MADNEAVFREYNERLTKELLELDAIAGSSYHEVEPVDLQQPLYFYCECSDEKCVNRVNLTIAEYLDIHRARNRFIIKKGHETPTIEKVVKKRKDFAVVDKHVTPSKNIDGLMRTSLNNA